MPRPAEARSREALGPRPCRSLAAQRFNTDRDRRGWRQPAYWAGVACVPGGALPNTGRSRRQLATNWSTAVQFWKTNAPAIKNWVLHELGRRDIAGRLDAVDRENVAVPRGSSSA